jgi:hypothetical protein
MNNSQSTNSRSKRDEIRQVCQELWTHIEPQEIEQIAADLEDLFQ